MVKAILFDLDGVLVDSIEAWFKLFNESLKHFRKKEFTWKKFLDKVWGGPIERDAKEFFGRPVEDIRKFYFDNFNEFKRNVKLFPNAIEVLKELRKRNLKIGLVTNTPRKQANKLLEHLKLAEYFDAIVGGDEVKNGKPAPDMIFEASKRMGINPIEAVLIGDTTKDIQSCKNAGCLSIGFRIDGDKRINNLKELMEVI